MRKVIVFTNLSLDGVMQAPRLPDEDLPGEASSTAAGRRPTLE